MAEMMDGYIVISKKDMYRMLEMEDVNTILEIKEKLDLERNSRNKKEIKYKIEEDR